MPAYYYSSTAGQYTLVGAVSNSATLMTLNSVAGLPSATPFKVVLEPGQPTEEIVKVTNVAGTSLTVVRGWDGTTAVAHNAAIEVRHMVTAEDFTLSRAHEDATTAHGTSSAVVGKDDAQALTNKDLTSATNVFPTTLATIGGVETLTNKTLDGAGNTFSNIPPTAIVGAVAGWTALNDLLTAQFQSRVHTSTSTVTVPNNTGTAISSFDTVKANVGSITYASGVFTIGVAGVYSMFCTVRWMPKIDTASNISRRRVYFQVNGTDVITGINDNMLQSGESLNAETYTTATGQRHFAAGDTVQVLVFQTTGSTLGLTVDSGAEFGITRIA